MLTTWPELQPSLELSPLPRAAFQDQTLSSSLLYPRAVSSNQKRAALIARPWQEARWSGRGHHLPGERSPLIFPSTILPLLSFLLPVDSRGAAKSTQLDARLIFQAPNASNLNEYCKFIWNAGWIRNRAGPLSINPFQTMVPFLLPNVCLYTPA